MRRPGVRGISILAEILKRRDPRLAPTESIFETRFYRLLVRSPLPNPVRQFKVFDDDGFVARLDLAWRWARVGVEALSLRWHSPRERARRDARRMNRLTALGWNVLTELYEDLENRPQDILDRLASLLHPPLSAVLHS